jgi:hypothetical protein
MSLKVYSIGDKIEFTFWGGGREGGGKQHPRVTPLFKKTDNEA